LWIERDGHVWLVRRPSKGMLGGMAALPGEEWSDEPLPQPDVLGTVRHQFTHFSLDLQVVPRSEPCGEGWWHPVERLGGAGLPTLYRRAVEIVLGPREPVRAAA
jgi:A/G-specific adenine glycosylase